MLDQLEISNIKGTMKVKNPVTGRFIAVNGPTYRRLCADKILNGDNYTDNRVVYKGDNCDAVLKSLNKTLVDIEPSEELYARNGAIRTRKKKVTKLQIDTKMKELVIEIYKRTPDIFKGKTPQEVVDIVQQLAIEEMVSDGTSSIKEKMLYIVENTEEDEEGESEDSDSEYDEEYDSDGYEADSDKSEEGKEMLETIVEEDEEDTTDTTDTEVQTEEEKEEKEEKEQKE